MREMHGVLSLTPSLSHLKRQVLIFDKFHALDIRRGAPPFIAEGLPADLLSDIEFLEQSGLLTRGEHPIVTGQPNGFRRTVLLKSAMASLKQAKIALPEVENDAAPICQLPIFAAAATDTTNEQTVLRVAIQALPAPDESCSWADILDFKASLHDKRWCFHRWLHSMASKEWAEAELRDEIEWMVNEYTKAMKIHHIKASRSFLDVFVISPLEIIENLVKFNWSKIVRGALQVSMRKVELLEAEMKAPGRECAYVFDARKRFDAG